MKVFRIKFRITRVVIWIFNRIILLLSKNNLNKIKYKIIVKFFWMVYLYKKWAVRRKAQKFGKIIESNVFILSSKRKKNNANNKSLKQT